MPSAATARTNVRIRPVPTGSPRARNPLPKATSGSRGWAGPGSAIPVADDLGEPRHHQLLVLVVLHDGTQRVARQVRAQAVGTQERERVGPVDRLRHAGELGQI